MKTQNLPPPFVQRMRQILGDEAEAFFTALKQEPPVAIRLNKAKVKNPDAMAFSLAQSVPWAEGGFYLKERPFFTLDPMLHAGAYYVQDASSMFLEEVLRQHVSTSKETRVLDLSAAPGGKSTAIASFLDRSGLLVANEIIPNRNNILQENLIKWGYPNVVVTQNDPKHFERLGEQFDVVLVDAPCSGEGLFRKDPEAASHWSQEAVQQCAWRQSGILKSAAKALKVGGILIYSTCTFEPEENEQQLKTLISQGFEPLKIEVDKAWGIQETEHNGLRFWPHKTKGEGFFIGVLRKVDSSHSKDSTLSSKQLPVTKSKIDFSPFLKPGNESVYQFRQDQIIFPEEHYEMLPLLFEHLNVRMWGTKAGTVKGKDFIPAHELAVSLAVNPDVPSLDLNQEEALKYLRRETFSVKSSAKGFHLVNYQINDQSFPIGWAKVLPNRINNLYPINWRIRMR